MKITSLKMKVLQDFIEEAFFMYICSLSQDVHAHTSKSCGKHARALSYISVVGCFLSLIGLFLTMLTYAIFR